MSSQAGTDAGGNPCTSLVQEIEGGWGKMFITEGRGEVIAITIFSMTWEGGSNT